MTTIADNDIKGLERYKYFLQTFNMAEYQQRISRMLNEYPELKALMNKLGMSTCHFFFLLEIVEFEVSLGKYS